MAAIRNESGFHKLMRTESDQKLPVTRPPW